MGSFNFKNQGNGILSIGRVIEDEESDDYVDGEVEDVKEFLSALENEVFDNLLHRTGVDEAIGGDLFDIEYGYYSGFQTIADTEKLIRYLDDVSSEAERKVNIDKIYEITIAFINYALANYAKENGYQECYGSWCGSVCDIDKAYLKGKSRFKKRYEQLKKDLKEKTK